MDLCCNIRKIFKWKTILALRKYLVTPREEVIPLGCIIISRDWGLGILPFLAFVAVFGKSNFVNVSIDACLVRLHDLRDLTSP